MLYFLLATEEARAKEQARDGELEKLIPQMATGDMNALEQVYHLTKTSVYGFALSILRHPQSSEDVMQETYVQLFRNAGAYQPQGKPMAWVLTVVRNLALMKLRSQKAAPLPLEEEWLLQSGQDLAQQSVDKLTLQAALTVLGEEERQIVMLHGLAGLKHREIAGLLQLPLSTVLNKYRRALSKLKSAMKEDI